MSLFYLAQCDFKFDIFEEISSTKDLSFYTAVLLLTYGDYDQIKATLEKKNVRKFIFFTEEGRNLVSCILKNDFKQMRKITLDIFRYLESDAIMSENLGRLAKLCESAFAKILTKNYTRVKISVVADFMITNTANCERFLTNEIASGRIDFKIDSDNGCLIKNVDNDLGYLNVFKRATEIIKQQNLKL